MRIAVVIAISGAAVAVAVALVPAGSPRPVTLRLASPGDSAAPRTTAHTPTATRRDTARAPHAPFAVGLRFEVLVDHGRTVHFANGTVAPRRLLTEIRYPALGPPRSGDARNAPPARTAGPFPLIVFGHGFGVTPGTYAPLMRAWARAGFVVAAPLFPDENPRAPGGPTAEDLPNEPEDMSFVISTMIAADHSKAGPFHGLLDPARIAVTGHSDGGDTALAAAYDPRLRDRRIGAAMILSGAFIPQLGTFTFPAYGPPLLATQGSVDPINLPSATSAFFAAAERPKFLLTLTGASHLPPYTTQQPQLAIVERVTIAFLRRSLGRERGAEHALLAAGNVAGVATLAADP